MISNFILLYMTCQDCMLVYTLALSRSGTKAIVNKTIQYHSSVFWLTSLLLKMTHPRGFQIINRFVWCTRVCRFLYLFSLFKLNSSHPLYNTYVPFLRLLVSTFTYCFQCKWTGCLTNIMYSTLLTIVTSYSTEYCTWCYKTLSGLTDRVFPQICRMWTLTDVASFTNEAIRQYNIEQLMPTQ